MKTILYLLLVLGLALAICSPSDARYEEERSMQEDSGPEPEDLHFREYQERQDPIPGRRRRRRSSWDSRRRGGGSWAVRA